MSRGALPGLLVSLALCVAGRATAMEVILEASGLPDGPDASRRLLSLAGDHARLMDPVRGRALHLDLKSGRAVEADLRRRVVRDEPWEARASRRAEARREALGTWRRSRDEALAREDPDAVRALDERLRSAGLRADGAVDLTLRREGPARAARLIVDGGPRTVQLERWVLRENQASTPLAEVWCAPELALADDPLRPFRGLLGPEAAARLASLPGPVLEASLQVGPGAPWTLRAVAVRQAPTVPERALTPPPWPPAAR